MALPPYQFSRLVKLLLVRYSIACLRLFVVILHCLQRFYHKVDHWGIKLHYYTNFDLHCLQRFYHNVDHWGIKLHHCCKIYIVYIDLITTLIIGVLHFIIIPISTFNGAFVSEIQ